MKIKIVLIALFGLVIGGVGGFLFLLLELPYLPLPVNSPLFAKVGIEKPRIVAFLPYFLTSRADKNYSQYITTLAYFGFTVDTDGHVLKLTNPQQEDPGWHDVQTPQLQKILTDAKNNHVILSLTVIQQDEKNISTLLDDPKNHANNLLADIIPVMKKYGFTDLNIDIESFQNSDAKKEDQFVTFVQTLTQGIQKQKLGTVTLDIAPIAFIKPYLVDPVKIGKIVDYMFVMAYDYHSVLSSNTGAIAPLYGGGQETEYDVNTTMNIAKKEIDPQKIIFGMPLYGYQWDSLSSEPGSATIPNTGQTASNRRIMTTFVPSCTTCVIKDDSLAEESDYIFQEKKGDPYFHQAFLFNTNYMNKRITYAQENNFAGVGLWALGYEGNTILNPLAAYKQTFRLQ